MAEYIYIVRNDLWLIDWMVLNAVFYSISVISRRPVHLSMLSWSFLTSTPHTIFSKSLAAFPHVGTTDSGARGMNPVAMTIINPRKEYWSSKKKILGKNIFSEPGIKPATFSSQVLYRYRLSYAARRNDLSAITWSLLGVDRTHFRFTHFNFSFNNQMNHDVI